ncbi:MAG: hypothetical protein Kow0042_31490 [Calditrichia bacterium]
MGDMRGSSRVDAHHFISFDVLDDQGRVTQSGMAISRDLSRKGVKIENRFAFDKDANVRIHLALGDDVVHLDGTVRHVEKISEDEFHIGIEFSEINKELIERLSQSYPDF